MYVYLCICVYTQIETAYTHMYVCARVKTYIRLMQAIA